MPNIIDTLVVALKLDPAGWVEGAAKADSAGRKLADDQAAAAQQITDAAEQAGEAQTKEAQKAGKALRAEAAAARKAAIEKEKAAKREADAQRKLAEKIHKTRMEAVDFVATSLAAAGVGKAIGSVFGGLEQLGYASKSLGLDPKTVDAYHMAIQKLGGDAGDFDQFASRVSTISSKLKQHIQLAPEERTFVQNLAQRFKVSQQDIEQNNITGIINSIAKSMDGLSARDQQVQLSQFLELNPGMIRLLQQGSAGVQSLYEQEYNLSQATQDATDKATTADQNWRQLKNTFSQTGTTLLADLAPALDTVNGLLATFNSLLEKHPQATAAGTVVTSVAGWFGGKWLMKKAIGKLFGKVAAEAAGGVAAGETAGEAAAATEAAATEAAAGTAAEAAAGAGGGLLRWLGPAGAGLYAMFRSENLNTGEEAQLAKIRALEKAGFTPPGPSKVPTPPPADTSALSTRLADSSFGMLIARGEGDYNVVNRGVAHGYKAGTENLPNMTVADVMAAQRAHRFNAAGRYQIIGDTLAAAAKSMGLSGNEKFDRTMQDRIFSEYLVRNKRKAIGDYLSGKSSDLRAAIKAASLEWASVADPDTGRSHYAGKGNNHASISVAEMGAALQASRAAGSTTGPSMAPMLAAANANQLGGQSTVSNSSVDTHIGTINVYGMNTKDGHAVVGGMRDELNQRGLALNGAYAMT